MNTKLSNRNFDIRIFAIFFGWIATGGTGLAATDITPPTATAPVQTIAMGTVVTGTVSTTVPIKLKWSAVDASGIQSYELWRSTNGGSYVRVALSTPTATSQTYRLIADNSYRFFVRAYDNAGNASVAKYGPTFTPHVIDDRDCCYYYGNGSRPWTRAMLSWAYNGTITTQGFYGGAFHAFTGRDVAYVAAVGRGWARAVVIIDDLFSRTVDLNSFPDAGAQIVFSKHWGTLAAHTIEVLHPLSIDWGYINVDAIVVIQ